MILDTMDDYAAFWAKQSEDGHQLMEVTCELATPVICDAVGGLHLDGPLAFAMFMDMSREDRESLPPMDLPWVCDFALPLSVRSGGDPHGDPRLMTPAGSPWWWTCSDNLIPWVGLHRTPVRGPTATREMIRYAKDRRVNTAVGSFKPINHTYGARWPEGGQLRWLAQGDPEEVRRLLTSHITSLGRRHNTGNGDVVPGSWRVTTIDGKWSDYEESSIRRIPHQGDDSRPRLGTIRAPYHHRSRQCLTVGPG